MAKTKKAKKPALPSDAYDGLQYKLEDIDSDLNAVELPDLSKYSMSDAVKARAKHISSQLAKAQMALFDAAEEAGDLARDLWEAENA